MAFAVGAVVGSFLNVCIYRLPQEKPLGYSRSACPQCGRRLGVVDLVPIVSWLLLRAKCRYCGGRISWQYPVVEVITGLLFAGIACRWGIGFDAAIRAVFVSLLIVCAFVDLNTQLILDKVTYPGMVVGVFLSVFRYDLGPVEASIGVLVSGGVVLLLAVLSKGGMGGGDIKLMGMVGAFLGWRMGLATLFAGALLGTLAGLPLMIAGKVKRRQPIPFGPFLALGAVVLLFFGEHLLALMGWR